MREQDRVMGAGAGAENKGEAVVRERGGQMVVHEAGKRWCENGYRKGNRCPRKEIGPFWAVCNNIQPAGSRGAEAQEQSK